MTEFFHIHRHRNRLIGFSGFQNPEILRKLCNICIKIESGSKNLFCVKVRAHEGNPHNEIADWLSKEAGTLDHTNAVTYKRSAGNVIGKRLISTRGGIDKQPAGKRNPNPPKEKYPPKEKFQTKRDSKVKTKESSKNDVMNNIPKRTRSEDPERLKLQRNNKNQKAQTNIDGKSEIKPKLRSPQTKIKHSTERVSRDQWYLKSC